MDSLIFLFVVFIALELFESNWQKSDSFYGVIENNYRVYSKSIFLFIILNPTFFYSVYLSLTLNNFGFFMSSIVLLKFVDISFRLHLMKKIHYNEDISSIVPLDIPMNGILRYINVIIYPTTFIFAIYGTF
jgi:hypothetical protein